MNVNRQLAKRPTKNFTAYSRHGIVNKEKLNYYEIFYRNVSKYLEDHKMKTIEGNEKMIAEALGTIKTLK